MNTTTPNPQKRTWPAWRDTPICRDVSLRKVSVTLYYHIGETSHLRQPRVVTVWVVMGMVAKQDFSMSRTHGPRMHGPRTHGPRMHGQSAETGVLEKC